MSTIELNDKEGAGCNNISTVSNDIVLNISSYLGARDLVSLALTCRRFGIVKDDQNSLVNKAAKDIINSKWTSDDERQQLPKYNDESWLELYHELEVLRSPLIFGKLVGSDIELVNTVKHSVQVISFSNSTAISNQIMRAGKHHVTFKCTGDMIEVSLGIIRPKVLDWENIQIREPRDHSCSELVYTVMSLGSGVRHSHYERKGIGVGGFAGGNYQRPVGGHPFYIGMTLDLDAGTLIVFKDGQRFKKQSQRNF